MIPHHGIYAGLGISTSLPALHGTVDVWLKSNDLNSLEFSSGNFVNKIKNKTGDASKDFVQPGSGQGQLVLNALNGKAVVADFITYQSGTTSSYVYMHDRSTAYAVFDVFAFSTINGSPIVNSTTSGGNTNGALLFPFGTNGLRKTIRQANADFTDSVDFIAQITGSNIYTPGNFFLISDVFYGYQVPGNDYELSINGNTPAVTQADSGTSNYPAGNHNYAYTLGGAGGRGSFAEKIIIKWPTQTRTQINEDLAAVKSYIQGEYELWQP